MKTSYSWISRLQFTRNTFRIWTPKHKLVLNFLLCVLFSTLTLWSRFSAHYPVSLGKVERRRNGTLSCYTPGHKWKCLWHEIHLRLLSAHFRCLESLVWEMSCGMIFKLHTCWSVSPHWSQQLMLMGLYLISAFLASLSTTQTEGSECLSSIKFSFNQTKTLQSLPCHKKSMDQFLNLNKARYYWSNVCIIFV